MPLTRGSRLAGPVLALLLLVGMPPLLVAMGDDLGGAMPAPPHTADAAPAGLAAADWSGILAARDASRHSAVTDEESAWVHNPGQQWTTRFDGRGALTEPEAGGWAWGLELRAYGFAGLERAPTGSADLRVAGQRVEYAWDDALTEWYVNDARGLEHGFTVHARPAQTAATDAPLTLTLAIRGALRPEVEAGGRDVRFVDAAGNVRLTYTGLVAFDADGRKLAAAFSWDGRLLRLAVDEHGARYPLTIDPVAQQAYLKASVTNTNDMFGMSVAVSGNTVVIGTDEEDSSATGVDGDQLDNSAEESGAVYVFVRNGGTWSQQAYLKASNTAGDDWFGRAVALSGDTILVGAPGEDSAATGVNGNQADDGAENSGAAYVFVRSGSTWTQQAYLKASNAQADDWFGHAVALSGDTAVIGAYREDSAATNVNGNQFNNSASGAGAAYVFVRAGTSWAQQAYLKASNSGAGDLFGFAVALSGDMALVGAFGEESASDGVNGDGSDNSLANAGAAYVFTRTGATWGQQAYLKAPVPGDFDEFGRTVALSGETAVVGAPQEDSGASGVDGDPDDDSLGSSGAACVFARNGANWSQQAYLKASNPGLNDRFGGSVGLSGDVVVVGAREENSSASGVNGNQGNESAGDAGAAYLFTREEGTWSQQAYLKASNTDPTDQFGSAVAISGDAAVVGAPTEDSTSAGVNGNQASNTTFNAGAAYVFDLDLLPEPWTDLGSGLAGVSGVPQLVGSGTLVGGDPVSLALASAKPGGSAALIVGLTLLAAPFKGGTLVPMPDVVVAGLPIDGSGSLAISATWPIGLPSGASFWVQHWITDPAGPFGYAASNALEGALP